MVRHFTGRCSRRCQSECIPPARHDETMDICLQFRYALRSSGNRDHASNVVTSRFLHTTRTGDAYTEADSGHGSHRTGTHPRSTATATPGGDQMTLSANTGTSLPLMADPDSTTGWRALGLCRMYAASTCFPSDGVGVDKARKICGNCPVKNECLEHALEHRIEHGVWGGCSERERRRILKRRRDLSVN